MDISLFAEASTVRSFTFYPVRISDCVTIGAGSIVEAAQIGLGVDIGKDCIIVRQDDSGNLTTCLSDF